jgi:hypothetical protein
MYYYIFMVSFIVKENKFLALFTYILYGILILFNLRSLPFLPSAFLFIYSSTPQLFV